MKYLKTYEKYKVGAEVKEGDYVVFLDSYDEADVIKNYPYKVEYVSNLSTYVRFGIGSKTINLRAFIKCDDGEMKNFRAKNSEVYRKITKEEAEQLIAMNKYNI